MKQGEQELLEFIQKRLLKDKSKKITTSTKLFKKGLIDSMNILDLIGYVEKSIKRKLTSEEVTMNNFQTIHTIYSFFLHEKK